MRLVVSPSAARGSVPRDLSQAARSGALVCIAPLSGASPRAPTWLGASHPGRGRAGLAERGGCGEQVLLGKVARAGVCGCVRVCARMCSCVWMYVQLCAVACF